MLERAQALVGEGVGGLWGGTFHHMANRMLRRHARRCWATSSTTRSWTRTTRAASCARLRRRAWACWASISRSPTCCSACSASPPTREKPLARRRRRRASRTTPIDIDDVVDVSTRATRRGSASSTPWISTTCWSTACSCSASTRTSWSATRSSSCYVLVDEYQDTNTIQAEWVDLLAGEAPQPAGGGRRLPEHLLLARRGLPQHHVVSRSATRTRACSSWRRTTAACRRSWPWPTPASPATRSSSRRPCAPTRDGAQKPRRWHAARRRGAGALRRRADPRSCGARATG